MVLYCTYTKFPKLFLLLNKEVLLLNQEVRYIYNKNVSGVYGRPLQIPVKRFGGGPAHFLYHCCVSLLGMKGT